jgi:hypothetical protein
MDAALTRRNIPSARMPTAPYLKGTVTGPGTGR